MKTAITSRFNPLKHCALCLYRVGFGGRSIERMIGVNRSLVIKWAQWEGIKRAPNTVTKRVKARHGIIEAPTGLEGSFASMRRLRMESIKAEMTSRQRAARDAAKKKSDERARKRELRLRLANKRRIDRQARIDRINNERLLAKAERETRRARAALIKSERDKRRIERLKRKAEREAFLKTDQGVEWWRQKRCWYNARYRKDPTVRMILAARTRMWMAIVRQGGEKTISWVKETIGCSRDELIQYLESKMSRGMTWENYGKVWEVDHIIPCAKFDLTRKDEQKRCFHFTNLQPLKKEANRIKRDKILDPQMSLCI